MEWKLNPKGCYYKGAWWDYLDEDLILRGIYRMTEHGWWEIRTCFYEFNVRTGKGRDLFLPVPDYAEGEVRRIVEAAWTIKRGES